MGERVERLTRPIALPRGTCELQDCKIRTVEDGNN